MNHRDTETQRRLIREQNKSFTNVKNLLFFVLVSFLLCVSVSLWFILEIANAGRG
jgi:cell division protein FtsL